MRLLLSLLLLTLGCPKPRAELTISGVTAEVPANWVPLAPERVASLREAALASDPSVEVSMVGRKPPDTALPWMYVQRTQLRPMLNVPTAVGALLERATSEVKTTLVQNGLELVSSETTTVGDTHEVCYATRSKSSKAPATPVLNSTCMRLWVDARTQRITTVSVVCLSLEAEPAECKRIVSSWKVEPGPHLALTDTWSP